MTQRILFKKKKIISYKYLFLLFLAFLLILVFYFYYNKNIKYYEITTNNKLFYIIPEDKGGIEIPNQDKKGLHLSDLSKNFFNTEKKYILKYSLQIFSSSNFDLVKKQKSKLLSTQDSIFNIENLSIVNFNSPLGLEYFLLYKNFNSRKKAEEYCEKYVHFISKCLVVNVQNLE